MNNIEFKKILQTIWCKIKDLQTALDGKQDKLSSFDESILIEDGGEYWR